MLFPRLMWVAESAFPHSVTCSAVVLMLASTDSSTPRPPSGSSVEPKSRGANRSTKVTGKLKILPERPVATAVERSNEESIGTTGESEGGDDEDEIEGVKVCLVCHGSHVP